MAQLQIVRRRVEHVDTDASGVVHFTRYASWLETAVLENLEDLGLGVDRLGEQGADLVVADLHMRYVSAARFLDQVWLRVRVEHVGGASFRFSGEVQRSGADGEVLLATGTLVLCLVGRVSGKAVALPADFRAMLRDCMKGRSDDRDGTPDTPGTPGTGRLRPGVH